MKKIKSKKLKVKINKTLIHQHKGINLKAALF